MVTIFSTRNSLNEENDEKVSASDVAYFNSNVWFFTTYESTQAIWHYSKSTIAWGLVFCSWQIPINPDTMNIIYGSMED